MKQKIESWVSAHSLYGIIAMMIAIAVLTINLLMVYISGMNVIILSCLMAAINIIIYVLCKESFPPQKKRLMFRLAKISSAIFLITLAAYPFAYLSFKIADAGKSNLGMISISLMFSVVATLLLLVFNVSEKGKKFYEEFDKKTSRAASPNNVSALNTGDIILCKDKAMIKETLFSHDTDESFGKSCLDMGVIEDLIKKKKANMNEVIPLKDRFLHMLILGPTGSGKTSQILLPMVYQDILNPNCGITVLEPKGDFAQKAAMMAKHCGREFIYFDPSLRNCPHFNPMAGKESDVVENMATTFRMLNADSPTFFLDLNEQLMRYAVKVLKRLDKNEGIEGKYATLINLSRLLQNSGGQGRKIVSDLAKVSSSTPEEAKENADIISWFQNEYFAEKSKVYENTSGIRSQVAKITSNEFLRDVLNPDPDKGQKNDIDFDKHLAEGSVICISTAQSILRELGKFLGYFIILQFQSAVFRRPGNEDNRRAHFLYIDEFQTYSNPGFADMLTQGRSYRVASHLATQARSQMAMGGGKDGKNFVELVSTNARNIVLFPGCNVDDAKYYSAQFGEYEKETTMVGISRKRFNLFTGGMDKLGHPTESIRVQQKMTPVFSPSELIFRPFGEIIYCIVKKNSVQIPKAGLISYIPKELNKELDVMVLDYLSANKRADATFIDSHPLPDFEQESKDFLLFPSDDDLKTQDTMVTVKKVADDVFINNTQETKVEEEDAFSSLEALDDDIKDPFDGNVD